jgi:hypothetical protein
LRLTIGELLLERRRDGATDRADLENRFTLGVSLPACQRENVAFPMNPTRPGGGHLVWEVPDFTQGAAFWNMV